MTRRFWNLLTFVVIVGVLIIVLVELGPQLSTPFLTAVVSYVGAAALIITAAAPVYEIVSARRRDYELFLKDEVLEKWETSSVLGGVRVDIGEISRTDPIDAPVFTILPAKVRRSFQRRYPDLLQAWEAAKAERRTLNDGLETDYRELKRQVQAIRDQTPIEEIDPRHPRTPMLDSKNLVQSVLEEARYMGRGAEGQGFMDRIEGDVLQHGGYVLVQGAGAERKKLKGDLETLIRSGEFKRLAVEIVHLEGELNGSPMREAFEAKRIEVIQQIKWKHPGTGK
jgi:hypothetical protein